MARKTNKLKSKVLNSADYWSKRAEYNFLHQEELQKEYVAKIESIYSEVEEQLQKELSKTYARYANNNQITNEEAYKKLNKNQLAQYKSNVFDYIKKAQKNADNPEYTKYLLNESLKHKVTVLDEIKTNWKAIVNKYADPKPEENILKEVYAKTSLATEFDIEKGLGVRIDFNAVDENKLNRVINETWAGGNFYSRYWGNQSKLAEELDKILVNGFATGQSYSKMAEKIANATGKSKARAMTLVRTECARLDNMATLDNLYDIKTKKFQYSATLDNRTSDICSSMDGQIFNIEDAEVGLNVPPLHPNCRSTIIPYEDENDITQRMERDIKTGKSKLIDVDDKYDYSDWAEEKYGKEVANKIRNNTLDLQTIVKSQSDSKTTFGKIIAQTGIGYFDTNSHKQKVDEARERTFTDIQAQDPSKYTEEFYDSQLEKIQELVIAKGNELTIRIKAVNLDLIVEDGRLKNQQQTGISSGNYNPEWRKTIEGQLFNIPLDAEDSLRPTYGYLSNKAVENGVRSYELMKYGDVKIVLKGELKERSTITFGDSMNNSARIYPSKFNEIKKTSIRPEDLAFEKWEDLEFGGYPEIQVHNGVLLTDIYKIEIPKQYKSQIKSKTISKLKNNGIKVVWK